MEMCPGKSFAQRFIELFNLIRFANVLDKYTFSLFWRVNSF